MHTHELFRIADSNRLARMCNIRPRCLLGPGPSCPLDSLDLNGEVFWTQVGRCGIAVHEVGKTLTWLPEVQSELFFCRIRINAGFRLPS